MANWQMLQRYKVFMVGCAHSSRLATCSIHLAPNFLPHFCWQLIIVICMLQIIADS